MVIDFAEPKQFTFDEGDRLYTATQFQELAKVAGEISALNDALAVNVENANSVVFWLKNTGSATMASGTIQLEVSINSTNGIDGDWVNCVGLRSSGNTNESSFSPTTLAANTVQANFWKFNVQGMKWFRARVSTVLATNSIASVTLAPIAAATEPIPAVLTHAVTNTPAQATPYSVTLAANTNTANIKNAAGHLFELAISNITGSTIYVKLYNKASAPTLASDVPIMTIPVPANSFQEINFGAIGKRFSTGIAIAVTGAIGPTDTTAVTAGSYVHASYL